MMKAGCNPPKWWREWSPEAMAAQAIGLTFVLIGLISFAVPDPLWVGWVLILTVSGEALCFTPVWWQRATGWRLLRNPRLYAALVGTLATVACLYLIISV
ncbi:MAG: hypothetical protein Q7K39_02295 [Candidatus Magasanikbacteria bacterium]|nr:hypothetical protein [Candidatus Magasanikbacteria bacterium]